MAAVTELGPGAPARHVDVHGGQAERALQRALDPADALGLLQRDPRGGPVDATGHTDGVGPRRGRPRGSGSSAAPCSGPAAAAASGPDRVPPSKRAIRCQVSCWDPTGSRALRTTAVPSLRWLRAVAPAMSTSSRHQPNGRHSSGSTWRTAWIRRVRDGLGDRLQQAPLDVHAFGSLDGGEVVLAREPAPQMLAKLSR